MVVTVKCICTEGVAHGDFGRFVAADLAARIEGFAGRPLGNLSGLDPVLPDVRCRAVVILLGAVMQPRDGYGVSVEDREVELVVRDLRAVIGLVRADFEVVGNAEAAELDDP